MTAQKFHDHFSAFANRYADFRPHYPAAIFDYLAGMVPRNSLVWDCACGNGQATIDLAERFDRVIATDASQEQIKSATRHSKSNIASQPPRAADWLIIRSVLSQLPRLCTGSTLSAFTPK